MSDTPKIRRRLTDDEKAERLKSQLDMIAKRKAQRTQKDIQEAALLLATLAAGLEDEEIRQCAAILARKAGLP